MILLEFSYGASTTLSPHFISIDPTIISREDTARYGIAPELLTVTSLDFSCFFQGVENSSRDTI